MEPWSMEPGNLASTMDVIRYDSDKRDGDGNGDGDGDGCSEGGFCTAYFQFTKLSLTRQ